MWKHFRDEKLPPFRTILRLPQKIKLLVQARLLFNPLSVTLHIKHLIQIFHSLQSSLSKNRILCLSSQYLFFSISCRIVCLTSSVRRAHHGDHNHTMAHDTAWCQHKAASSWCSWAFIIWWSWQLIKQQDFLRARCWLISVSWLNVDPLTT